jgi:hypothetical protein
MDNHLKFLKIKSAFEYLLTQNKPVIGYIEKEKFQTIITLDIYKIMFLVEYIQKLEFRLQETIAEKNKVIFDQLRIDFEKGERALPGCLPHSGK